MSPVELPLSTPVTLPDSTCPRCGGGFHCGAQDAGPCACTGLTLSPALQQGLRGRYQGCLCLVCLRALAQADAASQAQPG